jgi:hypothetical protein
VGEEELCSSEPVAGGLEPFEGSKNNERGYVTRAMGLALVLAAIAAGRAQAEGPVEPGKVFVGPEGLAVTIVPLTPRADHKVLIRVTGSGSAFDDKAIPHTVEDGGGTRFDYATTYRGRHWNTINVRDGRYQVNVPGHRDSPTVRYDEARTKALSADEVYKTYQRQQADGTLTKLAAFDRKEETARHEKQLADTTAAFAKACGATPAVKVDWASFSDADLRELSVASYCGEPLDKLAYLCGESREARQTIATTVKTFTCTMGQAMKLELAGATLAWTTSRSATNMGDFTQRFAEEKLIPTAAVTSPAPAPASGETPPWGKAATLGERMVLEKTGVCTDGKSHYVVVAPHDKQLTQLYYGDGKTFYRVPLPPWVLTGDMFFEPRFFAKTKNSGFRGVDLRTYAAVEYQPGKQVCAVACGDRRTNLTILDDAAKQSLLLGKVTFAPPLHKRAAHHLARDDSGRYFYVDRGNTPETEKSFRLFVGPKGAMKLQKMTNAVADTEGEIFTTKSGSLRYVTDRKNPPVWIQGGKKTKLTVVPIEGTDEHGEPINNYQLIYNDLGVYLGERLGNPCDDL